jgi:hypothetical protein
LLKPQLERQGAEIKSKVEEVEVEESLRNKLKDDTISQLSDQLVALSTGNSAGNWKKTVATDMKYYCSRIIDF